MYPTIDPGSPRLEVLVGWEESSGNLMFEVKLSDTNGIRWHYFGEASRRHDYGDVLSVVTDSVRSLCTLSILDGDGWNVEEAEQVLLRLAK